MELHFVRLMVKIVVLALRSLSVFSLCVFSLSLSLCFLSVFSVCVFYLCFLSVCSLCVSLCASVCFLSVCSVCFFLSVFSLCVLKFDLQSNTPTKSRTSPAMQEKKNDLQSNTDENQNTFFFEQSCARHYNCGSHEADRS